MEFKREIIVKRPVEEVWEVLGNQYGDAAQWASGLYHSEGFGSPRLEGASYNNRSCETAQGTIREVIREFDPENYILAYEVIEGFPFFVDTATNTWKLHPQGAHTYATMHLVMRTKGVVGTLMAPMMKMQMSKLLTAVIDDFKQYLETGQPSARKAKEMAKQLEKVA